MKSSYSYKRKMPSFKSYTPFSNPNRVLLLSKDWGCFDFVKAIILLTIAVQPESQEARNNSHNFPFEIFESSLIGT